MPTALRLAGIMESCEEPVQAQALLDRWASTAHEDIHTQSRFSLMRASLAFERRSAGDARTALHDCRTILRRMPARTPEALQITARYLTLLARDRFLQRKSIQALRCLHAALRHARKGRDLELQARILNNQGVALAQQKRGLEAIRCLQRAIRLGQRLGDVRAAALTTLNLARLHGQRGELVNAVLLATDCTRAAQRHGFADTLVRALRELADAYDRQYRPTWPRLLTYGRGVSQGGT